MNAETLALQHNNCAFLFLTESCNLSCRHCYVEASPASGQHMPLRVVELAFDLLVGIGIDDVRLTGGEPSVHPEFSQIVDSARRKGIRLGLVSNGVKLLNSVDALEIFGKLSRCWISLYGTSAESHSCTSGRNKESFYNIINSVGALTGQGCWVGLSVLVCPGDKKHIGNLMRIAFDAGIKKLRFLPLQPDGRARDSTINWSTWPEELLGIACVLREHDLSSEFEILTINDPFDLAGRFDDNSSSCLLRSRRMWSITPDGSVYPCCFTVFSDSLLLGNILDIGTHGRLREFATMPLPDCHGLKRSFWRNATPDNITCPIGSFDPRNLVLRDHANT